MKKLYALALIGAVTASGVAYAADQQDIDQDKAAISKDNAALSKDNAELSSDRAAKAAAIQNGDHTMDAKKSTAIGYDKTKIDEKKAEKDTDQKILNHDMAHDTDAAPAR